MAAETAARAFATVGVTPGSTVVINGASGGVGSAAVQLAVARGVRVIGVAGRANVEYVRALGAQPVVYGDGMVDRVREVAPDGVDFAVDIAGSGVIPQLVELTGDPARVVSIADFTAPQYGAKVTGGSEGRSWEALAEAADLYRRGTFQVEVQQVFPLADAAAAHRVSEGGHVRGKLVLDFTV
jgi:NADPH:quinone reductase-like Zn-dependent oxidoreductase